MNDSSGQSNPAPQGEPEILSRHEERQRRREERRAARGGQGGAWIVGAVLIVVGLALMAQNMGMAVLNNWWALFILIPAVGALGNAWRAYQAADGHLTASARGSLIGGLVLLMVTAVFLFNLNWNVLGPILIILAGVGLLLNTFLPD